MVDKRRIVYLYFLPIDYEHKVELFFKDQQEENNYFLTPLEEVLTDVSDEITREYELKANEGVIEDTYRHFKKDYKSSELQNINFNYKGKRIILENVKFRFDDDVTKKANYDDHYIKNISIRFSSVKII